ncbi:MAG TPA: hypothetical protein VF469_19165 [Kofleriaceae bacterium]
MTGGDDRITRALAQLGAEHEPPAGWEDRVLAAIEDPPERRRWWFAIPLAAMVVAAVLIVLHLAPKPDALALVVERGPGAARLRGGGAAAGRLVVAHGESIHAVVRGGDRHRAIWVYRDGADLVARCPGAPACRSSGEELTLDLTLPIIGTYQVIAWSSQAALPVPSGAYDPDVAAATAAEATQALQVVEVQ